MAHQLLIEFDIDFDSPLKRFLNRGEVIRGEPVRITLFVTNLARKVFPGGKVIDWRIVYTDIFQRSSTAEVHCEKIAPNEKVRLLSEEVVPLTEGLAWIHCNIEPDSADKEMKYYQDAEKPLLPLPSHEWRNCFYVVNRETLLLTSAIEEFAKRLHK